MPRRLLTTREILIWLACFLAGAAAIVWTGFTSSDPDSALYAGLAERLAQEPVGRWLAPEWWGFWPDAHMTGLFREHPAGVLLLPAALSKIGLPAAQGAYVVGVAGALAALLLMASLICTFTSRAEARAALVLLQLMPVAFIFRIRANHEYPMLVCLLLAVQGLVWTSTNRRPWLGTLLVSVGLTAGLFVKGVFVAKILLAIAVWIAVNPLGSPGARLRAFVAGTVSIGFMIVGAVIYEITYQAATAEPFWVMYWQRQLGPLAGVSSWDTLLSSLRNLAFYLSRLVWHPAPWSIALLVAGWRMRHRMRDGLQTLPPITRRGLMFTLIFAGLAVLLLTPATRFAERYAFSASHAIACAGVVAAFRIWPAVAATTARLDAGIPAFAPIVWILLALLRLGAGTWLPRVS